MGEGTWYVSAEAKSCVRRYHRLTMCQRIQRNVNKPDSRARYRSRTAECVGTAARRGVTVPAPTGTARRGRAGRCAPRAARSASPTARDLRVSTRCVAQLADELRRGHAQCALAHHRVLRLRVGRRDDAPRGPRARNRCASASMTESASRPGRREDDGDAGDVVRPTVGRRVAARRRRRRTVAPPPRSTTRRPRRDARARRRGRAPRAPAYAGSACRTL